ncbi:hypothetical protein KOAAANKH_02057 [Brevundimonas sp. NIBR10]|uniref:hypothetical protein n=1 Tax=Brevundimonas sp. NIBR10 TaxID=3015997 RepID=UPI0022F17C41|nr:hypothetical protein [Brevundimonas sp. NIBR10]WGM47182.1 hypothetical protein KOAAANKH_02057 [Brevundimonas sp. NIBR10]
MMKLAHRQSLWSIFRWPLLLGVLSLTGLIGALLWDGLWDWLGTALIAVSAGTVMWVRIRVSTKAER